MGNRKTWLWLPGVMLVGALGVAGCSSDDEGTVDQGTPDTGPGADVVTQPPTEGGPPAKNDGGDATVPTEAGQPEAAPPEAAPPKDAAPEADAPPPAPLTFTLRAANLAVLGTSTSTVDVCVAAQGATLATATPIRTGVGFGQFSTPLTVTSTAAGTVAGTYNIGYVAGGAASCGTLLASTSFTLVAGATTAGPFALTGAAAPYAVTANVFPAKGSVAFNNGLASALTVGLGGGDMFTSLATVAAGASTSTLASAFSAEGSIRLGSPGSGTDIAALTGLSTTDATAVYVVGTASTTPQVRICVASTATCAAAATPVRANVRVANLSPDAPAFDFCLSRAATFAGAPFMSSQGATADLVYSAGTATTSSTQAMSRYVVLPTGAWNILLVPTSTTDCAGATPIAAGTSTSVTTVAGYYTVAAVGTVAVSSSTPAFRVVAFTDDSVAPASFANFRAVHAITTMSGTIDIGVTSGATLSLFSGLTFGDRSRTGVGLVTLDANGYVTSGAVIGARITGTATVSLTTLFNVDSGALISTGSLVTAYGVSPAQGASFSRVLLCSDGPTATASGAYSVCTLIPSS